jgi:hypothetical protein
MRAKKYNFVYFNLEGGDICKGANNLVYSLCILLMVIL